MRVDSLPLLETIFVAVVMVLFVMLGGAHGEDGVWTLDQALAHALAHNPDLAENAANIEVAEQTRREVFGNFLPQLTGTAGYQYVDNVPAMEINIEPDLAIPNVPPIVIEKTVEMGDHDNWKAELALEQVLFASGRVYYGHQAASHRVDAARLQNEALRVAVARQTAEAFLGVLISQQVFEAQSESLARAQAHLKHVQNRFDAGAASRFEFLRAQVEVDNIEPEVSRARQAIALAGEGFRRAMGLSPDAPVQVTGKLATQKVDPNKSAARQKARAGRAEFDAYQAGEKAYRSAAGGRLGEMLPAVMLTGTYGYQKPYYFDADGDTNWTVGAGIQIPLFDGLKAYRGREANLARAAGMRRARQRFSADVENQISAAILGLDEADVRIQTTQANVDRALTMVGIAEESYAHGALTSLDVIDAQLAATGARLAHLRALYDYRVAKVRLAAATGDLQAIGR